MKPGKPDRGISKMEVLKDIRELLSVTQEREDSGKAQPRDEGHLKCGYQVGEGRSKECPKTPIS